jgi:hypothetical protein
LITTILDTDISEAWITSIGELEQHLDTVQARGRVKAAKDMVELMAQVQLVVCFPRELSHNHAPSPSAQGHRQDTHLLHGDFKTHQIEHDHKHASNSDFGAPEVPATIRVPPAARAKCGFGVPKVLHRSRKSVL